MKKVNYRGYAVLGILFVVVTIVAFAIPLPKTAAFWVAYIFTAIAFAVQIAVWKKALSEDKPLKSKFLGLPVVHISTVYLILQIVALAVFTAKPLLPMWIALIAGAIILGISAVCMIASDIGREEIQRVDAKVRKKVFYIKELQADVEMLAEGETDASVKSALNQLSEKIRFSDPMSSDELRELEEQITRKISQLKAVEDKLPIVNEIDLLLTERNKKCKILK